MIATISPAASLPITPVLDKGAEIGQRRPLIGDDLDRAHDHQPSGSTQESADDRKGHEPNRASGVREPKDAKHEAGKRCRQRHDDERRLEKVGASAMGNDALDHGCDHGRDDDGNRAVRPGDGERQRAA